MKAWELIKHLEEGGDVQIINEAGLKRSKRDVFDSSTVLSYPNKWETVKPKKTVKLKAYLQSFWNGSVAGDKNYGGLVWCDDSFIARESAVRVPEEDKVIEVEE